MYAPLCTRIEANGPISFDLSDYGVSQPVGIGSGQGKLFVADEIDVPNSGGMIHIFKSPRRVG
jgi:hypothetical protein